MTIHTITTPSSWIFYLRSLHMCRTQCFHSPISKTQLKNYQYYFSTSQLFSHTLRLFIPCPRLLLNRMDKRSSSTVSPNFSSAELLCGSRPAAILVNAAVHLTEVTTAFESFPRKRHEQLAEDAFYSHKYTREAVTALFSVTPLCFKYRENHLARQEGEDFWNKVLSLWLHPNCHNKNMGWNRKRASRLCERVAGRTDRAEAAVIITRTPAIITPSATVTTHTPARFNFSVPAPGTESRRGGREVSL